MRVRSGGVLPAVGPFVHFTESRETRNLMTAVNFEYIDKQGVTHAVSAEVGETLMEVATANGVPGIDADCGGCCACGTCRVRLDEAQLSSVPAMQDDERDVLAFGGSGDARERLGCQIRLTEAFADTKVVVATD